MIETKYRESQDFAFQLDTEDPLKDFRDHFHIPRTPEGNDAIYFAGNSLGLQPRHAKHYIEQELKDWANLGVEGHFHAKNPWLPYHEFLTKPMADIVGALPIEVVVMNTLTVNLHLMLVSFYRPTQQRYKIVVEGGAFPSDQYAIASQVRFHGFDPDKSIIEIIPKPGEFLIDPDDIIKRIQQEGESISLILFGNVNYLTGQAFNLQKITEVAHAHGCRVGFDLAHGAGNLALDLHQIGPDFSVWCSYKYLNGGPGATAGCFIHERHALNTDLPRFAGWWGHDKSTRFQMGSKFQPIPGAEGWQLSNPSILPLASLRASLELFQRATLAKIRAKSVQLTRYLELLLNSKLPKKVEIITPQDPLQRGSQLSLKVKNNPKKLIQTLACSGVICDFREPNIIRVAPVPLYNRYMDVYHFVDILYANSSDL